MYRYRGLWHNVVHSFVPAMVILLRLVTQCGPNDDGIYNMLEPNGCAAAKAPGEALRLPGPLPPAQTVRGYFIVQSSLIEEN